MYAFTLLVVAACFTSFYSWRLIFMTFYGPEKGDHHAHAHAHESPLVMTIPLAVLAVGAVFAAMNTMYANVASRTREIGTLAALGMEGKTIVRLFFFEAAMLGTLGAFVGTLIGSVIALILEQTGLDFTSAMGEMSFEISGIMYPKLTWGSMAIAFFGAVFVASLISLWPAQRAAKIKPIEAMQSL